MEPLNKGHFGANSFVPCREVVPISEGPLSEVPLYMETDIVMAYPIVVAELVCLPGVDCGVVAQLNVKTNRPTVVN